jgi:hypothetical protein
MIAVREARLWTSLFVVGLSVAAISSAWPMLRFALGAQSAKASNAQARLGDLFDASPAAPLARKLALTLSPPTPPAERAAALTDYLALTPMASGAWLDLAIARRAAGAPMAEVASALAMSATTGPNEGRFMAGRAAFGLPLWDQLPPSLRRGLARDLVDGWGELSEAQRRAIDDGLTIASDRTRAQVLAALLLESPSALEIVKALDLADAAAGQGAGAPGASGRGMTAPGADAAPAVSSGTSR